MIEQIKKYVSFFGTYLNWLIRFVFQSGMDAEKNSSFILTP